MAPTPLTGVRACVFDAYGPLFDFASAARGCSNLHPEEMDKLTALWRDKQLQYTWLRAAQQRHVDFWQVTGDALDFALDTLRLDRPSLRDRLMALYLTLDAYPEVASTLERLKRAGMRTTILSIRHARRRRQGREPRRPARCRSFGRGGSCLQARSAGLSTGGRSTGPAGLRHRLPIRECVGCHAASAFGMRVVWCNRFGQRRERLPGEPDREIRSLAELPALVGAA
jgi:2-haloacid dehalogenase